MPLTIVKKFDKEYGKKIIKESLDSINNIGTIILNDEVITYKIPISSILISKINYIENFMAKLFALELYANKKCVKCGKCVKICPKNNIVMKNKIKFKLKCMMCMRCIYKCPVRAIHPRFSKFIEFRDGYDIKEYLD